MKKSLSLGIIFLFILSALAPMSVGQNLIESKVILDRHLYPEFYNAYSVDEIYGYEPRDDIDIKPDYMNIESKEIESFKQLTEPLGGPMDSAWPMYCHDICHTGRSPYSTAGNVGFNKWWHKCDHYIEGSAAIDKDGIIYFGGAEDDPDPTIYFYALYPNGTVKWKCEIDWFIESGPAIAEDGTIYAGDRSFGYGKLYAINSNGTIKWKYQTNGVMYSSPVIGTDGTIFVGDGNNYINAINPNGTLKWRYKTGLKVYSSPAIGDDGTLYCGSHDNYLYALYPNNGTLKWKYKTGHWIRTSPCIGDDGTIYCVSLDNYLHAVYPNGTRKWITKVGAGTSPTIGQDGTIYCGWDRLHAVNPIDGSIKWSFNPGSSRYIEGATPCTSADGTIYFGTRIDPHYGGEIIAVTPYGTEKWRKMIAKEYCQFAPVIGEDGTVYIGSSTLEEVYSGFFQYVGYLYAFNEKDNNAPSTPKITGPAKVNSKAEIDYTFKSTSPLGNDVYYFIDWGDGDWRIDWWLGPYDSGKNAVISHIWSNPGKYTIKSRCKDTDNLWSDWSEFKVTIPRSRALLGSVRLRFFDMFPILQRILGYIL